MQTARTTQASGTAAAVSVTALAAVALLASVAPATAVEYTVTFDSTWSSETHPTEFPPSPHYSGLIGGTHNGDVTFWEPGELASPGIKRMAETGSKSPLDAEVESAITAGTALAVLSGGGIGNSPGSVDLTFSIEDTHSLVTLVSMLAPSPDWFVGVSGVELRPGGEWAGELVVDLVVWDAGTDSGESYTSSNQPTVPPVPIFAKTDGPFAENPVVGTFTFTLDTTSDAFDSVADTGRTLLPLSANPLRDVARFELRVPELERGNLGVYDSAGRLVRSLQRSRNPGQTAIVEWDGRDERGVRVAAGTYFLTLRAGATRATEKIVVAR